MGMTIEEAINTLEYIKNNPTNDVDAQLLPEAIELFDTAIDTMRKFQKIQEQVELSEKENHKIDVARMIQIREFIYGNDT